MTPGRLAARVRRMPPSVVSLAVEHRGLEAATVVHTVERSDDVDTAARVLLDAAVEYVDEHAARCDLAVVGRDAGGRARATVAWLQDPTEARPETDMTASDISPSMQGLSTQLMRHSEVQQRLLLNNLAGLLGHYKGALSDSRARIGELERELAAVRVRAAKAEARRGDAAEDDEGVRHEMMGRAAAMLEPIARAVAAEVMERGGQGRAQ